jgi:hypothetical protein
MSESEAEVTGEAVGRAARLPETSAAPNARDASMMIDFLHTWFEKAINLV